MKYERITIDPTIMMGKPVIKDTRIPVEQILRELAGGLTVLEIIDAHPRLTPDDIDTAIAYDADIRRTN